MLVPVLVLMLGAGEPAAAEPPAPVKTSAEKLADAQALYQQSCANHAYGSYEDLCNGLKAQIDDYQKTLEREAREAARAKKVPAASGGSPPR